MTKTETMPASEPRDRGPLLLLVALSVVFVIVCAQAMASELHRTSSAAHVEPRPSAAPRGLPR
jgi:hypothetical protein